ncbi:MAG: iron-sulfur cluster-binding protein [Methylophaga sp.]|nr:MAG: iron-sulfur cluster-binding protein [Methylophaga sp.]
MQPHSKQFKSNVTKALADPELQKSLFTVKKGLVENRAKAISLVSDFELLREKAKQIKQHTLSQLDYYLEEFETNFTAQGGQLHWAKDASEAQQIIVGICHKHNAKTVVKGKSMAGEEISINEALEAAGIEPIETDLGEYIVQLANEPPSHIIVPCVHKTRAQIIELFAKHHKKYGYDKPLTEVEELVLQVREIMRSKFLNADIGITGANFLVAETGTSVIVTNEGNGDLCSTLPKVHIVTAGLEKIVPTLNDVSMLSRLLARSATGQESTAYTTFATGPQRSDDQDGPEEMHIVLIDNGRTDLLNSELSEMLRCIRCGACINHCPVYGSVGGHAYGWVYPGPMGAVLTPAIIGLEEAGDLPNACTLNGRCETVCPVKIPLPKLLRLLRVRQFKERKGSMIWRGGIQLWGKLASYPVVYHFLVNIGIRLLSFLGAKKGRFNKLLLARSWTQSRDFPSPQGSTFHSQWKKYKKDHHG